MPNYPVGPNPGYGTAFNAANSGALFIGGNQAVVATALTAGVPTAYTGGLILYNPLGNTGNNLVILRAQVAFILAQTNPAVISLGVGYSASPLTGTLTAVPAVNGNAGSPATPTGLLYSSASVTLPAAPVRAGIIGAVNTGAETVGLASPNLALDVNGSIILQPGGYACILSSAAGTASSMLATFTWVET
jgi:hypothetical protein